MLNLICITMPNSEFSTYLSNYFLDWQKINGRSSIRNFSKWLGIHYSLVDQWMNGNGKPGPNNLAKLAAKIGPDIYKVLEIEPPEIISITHLPPEFRERLERALAETNSELASRGLSTSDPEAEEITIKIFGKHGFKYTRTTH